MPPLAGAAALLLAGREPSGVAHQPLE